MQGTFGCIFILAGAFLNAQRFPVSCYPKILS